MLWPSVSNVFSSSLVATQPTSLIESWMMLSEFSIERVKGMVTCHVIDSFDWLIIDTATINTFFLFLWHQNIIILNKITSFLRSARFFDLITEHLCSYLCLNCGVN